MVPLSFLLVPLWIQVCAYFCWAIEGVSERIMAEAFRCSCYACKKSNQGVKRLRRVCVSHWNVVLKVSGTEEKRGDILPWGWQNVFRVPLQSFMTNWIDFLHQDMRRCLLNTNWPPYTAKRFKSRSILFTKITWRYREMRDLRKILRKNKFIRKENPDCCSQPRPLMLVLEIWKLYGVETWWHRSTPSFAPPHHHRLLTWNKWFRAILSAHLWARTTTTRCRDQRKGNDLENFMTEFEDLRTFICTPPVPQRMMVVMPLNYFPIQEQELERDGKG